jgi:putative ABC transport system permease protein
VAAGAGVAVAVLAALVPAVQAAHEEPASAVRRIPPVQGWGHRAVQVAASAALLAAGMVVMLLRDELPPRWGTYGGFVLVLLGMLLTTPLLAAAAARLVQPLARALLPLEGWLAADNLVRSPGRTGLVITVLAAGVAIFIQTAGVIRSNEDPILDWVDQTTDAELYVMSGSTVVGSGQNLQLRADLAHDITIRAALRDDVEAVLPVRGLQVNFRDSDRVYLIALDARGFAAGGHHGPLEGTHLYQRLAQPGAANAVVSENFAVLYHVKEGDVISIRGPRGPVRLNVAGVVVDYSFNRGAVIIDRELYRQHFHDALADMLYVYLRPGADVEAVRRTLLENWGTDDALVVLTRGDMRKRFIDTMTKFATVAYAQELVVALVAALGVVFALLISVLQRRRELGILRAVGATQSQIVRSVLAEAALMGAIGTLIGLAVGIPVEWYIMHVLIVGETGMFLPVLIPWLQAGIIAGGALVVATLAGLMPALRTMHLRIPEAIAYE